MNTLIELIQTESKRTGRKITTSEVRKTIRFRIVECKELIKVNPKDLVYPQILLELKKLLKHTYEYDLMVSTIKEIKEGIYEMI